MDRQELLKKLEADISRCKVGFGSGDLIIDSKAVKFDKEFKLKINKDRDDERVIDSYPVLYIEGGQINFTDNCKIKKIYDNEILTSYKIESSLDNTNVHDMGVIEFIKDDILNEFGTREAIYNEDI